MIINNLSHEQIKIEWDWQEKAVTFCLSADVTYYAVLMLFHDDVMSYQKFSSDGSHQNFDIRLSFFPQDMNSDSVQVSLYQSIENMGGGTHLTIEDNALKENPKNLVTIPAHNKSVIHTGTLIHLAKINSVVEINARILLVSKADTESVRGRWRLKSNLSDQLPANLKFLSEGRLAGSKKLEN